MSTLVRGSDGNAFGTPIPPRCSRETETMKNSTRSSWILCWRALQGIDFSITHTSSAWRATLIETTSRLSLRLVRQRS
jgi:hypothetical protein